MNVRLTGVFAAILLIAGCGEPTEPRVVEQAEAVDPALELAGLFDEFFERGLELNPIRATGIGDSRYNDRLAITQSVEYRDARRELDEEFLARLLRIDRSALSYDDRLSYDMFRILREQSLEANIYPSHLQPLNQFRLMTNSFVRLGSGASVHPFETVKDYEDFLSRAEDFIVNVDHAIENMQEGMRQGIVQPRVLMMKVVPQIESQLVDDARDSDFWMPIENMPEEFSEADRERLAAAYEDAIENRVLPAFERLNNFINDEYMAASRDTFGLGDLPGGDDWYNYLVRVQTTTNLTPDEIHRIGLDEVARIHDEMRGVMADVGFEGDLHEFFEFVNTDDRFFFEEPEDMIQAYRDMSDDIAERATALFDVRPEAEFEIRAVEPFRERSASGGSYQAGAPDGSRPGIFYANTYDLRARPIWAMESLYLHEAIPGHYFQIELQQENEALPRFRRFGRFTAYTEGWGLYAETLGKELGVYTDPYQYFGNLNWELWRSIRLVVDTGIHAKGWTRQEVLDYMYANAPVAPARAISEAERFMAIPGQALAYKIGQLRIRAIRDSAEARLGEAFDVVAFHREVLMDGPMPLSMLESKMDRWVDDQLSGDSAGP